MQLLGRLGPLNDAQKKYTDMHIQNGRVLKELIVSLFDIGSIDHRGADGLVRKPCNPPTPSAPTPTGPAASS